MNVTNFIKKASLHLLILAILVLNSSCKNSQALFQENASNWDKNGNANWEFSDNVLSGSIIRGTGFVMTNEKYNDFILELEFNPDSAINSGIFIRCGKRDITTTDCYEINVWDTNPNQDNRTGAVVTKAPPLAIVETLNKWNTYKIKAKKDHLQVWVNGILTADILDNSFSEGFVGLQALGNNESTGKIQFRNVKITPLK